MAEMSWGGASGKKRNGEIKNWLQGNGAEQYTWV